jgi:vesicle-associated membrane protein 4
MASRLSTSKGPFGKLFFLGAARLSDKLILATQSHNGKAIELSAVKQMLYALTSITSGQLYTFGMGEASWNLMETGGVIYIMAVVESYPTRIAAQCLNECATLFIARVQDSWKTCKEGALASPAHNILVNLCTKYDNLLDMDKVASTMAKVEAVKLQMQDNIQQSLENCIKLEKISADAEELQAQAGIFRGQAKQLRSNMCWQNFKTKLVIAAIVVVILLIIILAICVSGGGNACKSDSSNNGK